MTNLTPKQKETLEQVKEYWDNKGFGTYINRKNSKCIYALAEKNLVKIFPYCMEFGNVAYPAEVCG